MKNICATAALLFIASASHAEDAEKHLFILSGQSNMTGGLKSGFVQSVEDVLGKENVTVVMSMKSGRGIRFWDKDYKFPDNYQFPGNRTPEEKHFRQHGSLYSALISAVNVAIEGKTFDTVTFIWMQGESDAGRALGDVYGESFLRLLARLRADLKRKELNFVVGRLSDADMSNQKSPHWTKMREVQVKLAEGRENGAWIDTDDLNGGEPGKPGGHVHYPAKESKILGQRFANKAIELIQTKQGSSTRRKETMTKPRPITMFCLMVAAWIGVCRDSDAAPKKEQVTLTAEGENTSPNTPRCWTP